MAAIKVLVVDDSAIVRQTLERELAIDREIVVVGTAADPYIAREKIISLKPDVITLDIEMPRMDGLSFLRKLMRYYPIPVVIVSSLSKQGSETALEAIQNGAVEVMCKPGSAYSIGDMSVELREKIKSAAKADLKIMSTHNTPEGVSQPFALTKSSQKIVLLGASTGGTQAIELLLKKFPSNSPGTVIVQHMPAGFTKAFSERLNKICNVEVKEAENGDTIIPGRVLIAPGNMHALVKRSGGHYYVEVKDGPLVGHHRPSVEVLFQSAAQYVGKNAIGVMLTGMGNDGASAMLKMKEAGSVNIAQDEKTCVVYGMPKAVVQNGAADYCLPLDQIAAKIFTIAQEA